MLALTAVREENLEITYYCKPECAALQLPRVGGSGGAGGYSNLLETGPVFRTVVVRSLGSPSELGQYGVRQLHQDYGLQPTGGFHFLDPDRGRQKIERLNLFAA